MKETDLVQCDDPNVWAVEFMRIWGDRLQDISEELMIGWFANAMYAGKAKLVEIGRKNVK